MVVSLPVSSQEIADGRLTDAHLSAAVEAIRRDGVVVLEGIVSQASITALRDKMLEDVDAFVNRKDAPYNWNKGNVQQDPPPFPPYLFRDVLVNDLVIQVSKAILGAGMKNGMYSGNTAMPSEQRQPVHADSGQLWTAMEHPHPPYALVVNLPLVDVSARNGSTEIWLGTHTDPSVSHQGSDITLSAEALDAQAKVSPPLQPEIKAGSVVIRDIRMWHAGMPNRTEQPRPMVAMIHYVNWWPTGALRFRADAKPFLEHPDLWWHVEYTDETPDYVATPGAYAYEEGK